MNFHKSILIQKKRNFRNRHKGIFKYDDFKINKDNDPRIFANTLILSNEKSTFDKSIFTICDYRRK